MLGRVRDADYDDDHLQRRSRCTDDDGKADLRANDYAFSAEPRPEGCLLSVSVNELELLVDERDRRVGFVEGYCPHFGWRARALVTPRPHRAGLVVVFDEAPVPGATRRVSDDARWPVFVDPSSRWVCVGEPASEPTAAVEFALDTLAVLDELGRLRSLWLRLCHVPREIVESLKAG